MESRRRILVLAIDPAAWPLLKKEMDAGRHERLRRAADAARASRISAAYPAEPVWQRLSALGKRAVAIIGPHALFPSDLEQKFRDEEHSALSLCEIVLERLDPDLLYVAVESFVTGGDLEDWLERFRATLGENGRLFACAADTPLDGDAIARLLDEEDGLSETDAAELRDRLMGLGYL